MGIPVLLGEKTASFMGIPYSYEYFQKSLVMVNRSLIILLSVRMITGKISPEKLSHGLKKIRLHNFSEVYSVAMNVLPELKIITRNSFSRNQKDQQDNNIFAIFYQSLVIFMVNILNLAEKYYNDQSIEPKKQ